MVVSPRISSLGHLRNGIRGLKYASKDALDFYNYLIHPKGGNFQPDQVLLLRDQAATRYAIEDAFNQIKQKAQGDDLVLLYFSSHGTPPDKFGGVHIVTYDAEVNPRERIWQTAISEDLLREFIQGIRAKRLLVIMDACYSNGAYAQIVGFLPAGGKSLDLEEDEGHGQSRIYLAERLLGAKDLALEPEPPQPANAYSSANGWGKVLISASDADEKSWESDNLHNGIFTYFFSDGLKRYGGAIQESFNYAKPLLNSTVKKEKGGDIEQNPQVVPDRYGWNMSISEPAKPALK